MNPGSVLLPTEGEGRNAVYAATQGWDVTAFDSRCVAIDYSSKDVMAFNLETKQ